MARTFDELFKVFEREGRLFLSDEEWNDVWFVYKSGSDNSIIARDFIECVFDLTIKDKIIESSFPVGYESQYIEEAKKKLGNLLRKDVVKYRQFIAHIKGYALLETRRKMSRSIENRLYKSEPRENPDSKGISDPFNRISDKRNELFNKLVCKPQLQLLTDSIEKLTDLRKTTIKLIFYEKISPKEIAKEDNTTENTIAARKRQALKKLYEILLSADFGKEPSDLIPNGAI